jgi:hypothetical protein
MQAKPYSNISTGMWRTWLFGVILNCILGVIRKTIQEQPENGQNDLNRFSCASHYCISLSNQERKEHLSYPVRIE